MITSPSSACGMTSFSAIPACSQLISQYDYMHTLLASNLRWMFGHLNELLLPDDLFEEILTATRPS